jgi:hypothetical protein
MVWFLIVFKNMKVYPVLMMAMFCEKFSPTKEIEKAINHKFWP